MSSLRWATTEWLLFSYPLYILGRVFFIYHQAAKATYLDIFFDPVTLDRNCPFTLQWHCKWQRSNLYFDQLCFQRFYYTFKHSARPHEHELIRKQAHHLRTLSKLRLQPLPEERQTVKPSFSLPSPPPKKNKKTTALCHRWTWAVRHDDIQYLRLRAAIVEVTRKTTLRVKLRAEIPPYPPPQVGQHPFGQHAFTWCCQTDAKNRVAFDLDLRKIHNKNKKSKRLRQQRWLYFNYQN